jgi:putative oligomerization/nucleic acid binding protein
VKPDITPFIVSLAGMLLVGCASNPTHSSSASVPVAVATRSQQGFPQAPDSSAKLNGIRIGMAREEVLSVMGAPDSKSAQANVEYLTYYLLNSGSDFERHQPYMIRLVSGRVESFGRFSELADIYNRPVTNATPGHPDLPQLGLAPSTASPNGTISNGPGQQRTDLVAELVKLKQLRDQGALTDEEYAKAKAMLLSEP